MSRSRNRSCLVALLVLLAVSLSACEGNTSSAASSTESAAAVQQAPVSTTGTPMVFASTFVEPFAYCSALRDALHPDSRYTGPQEPVAVVRALESAMHSPAGALDHYAAQNAVYWRCMHGDVYGCSPGANLECWTADADQRPTKAMNDWCAQHPASAIPAVVSGHSTIYEWTCSGGTAERGRQLVELDEAGLNARIWYRLARQP